MCFNLISKVSLFGGMLAIRKLLVIILLVAVLVVTVSCFPAAGGNTAAAPAPVEKPSIKSIDDKVKQLEGSIAGMASDQANVRIKMDDVVKILESIQKQLDDIKASIK